jgi:hypothetical protein
MVVPPASTGQSAMQIAKDVDRTSGNRARRCAKRRNKQTIMAQGATGMRHRIGRASTTEQCAGVNSLLSEDKFFIGGQSFNP